jgi:hypothetical protein
MTFRRSAVLVTLLLLASTIRAEFPVTEERPLAPTLGISRHARVVATDDGFLAFWKTSTTYSAEGLMQVAKLSPDGALLRRAVAWDLPASFHAYDGASNGEETLLAGSCSGTYGAPLCLARFSRDGDFLGLTTTAYVNALAPSLASDGRDFAVTFSLLSGVRGVFALPVSREGVAGAPIAIGPWDASSHGSSPAAIGGTYFVAFPRPGGHALARLSIDAVESTVPLDPPVEISEVRIESSGERLLVVVSPRGPAPSDIWLQAAVFDPELRRLTDWFLLTGHAGLPRIAPTSSGWIVSGGGAGQAKVVAISRAGSVGETVDVEGPGVFDLDLAAARDRAALVWTTGVDHTVPGASFNAARVAVLDASAAIVRAPTTISLGPAPQIHPAGAHAGGVTLAAWVERTIEERFVVKVRPFDRNGVPLAPPVTMPWRGVAQGYPSVASDGASFFVVWSEGAWGLDGVWGARVTTDGRVLDAGAIPLFGPAQPYSGEPRTADVDWSGDWWLVVSSAGNADIVARRVSSAGTLTDADPAVIAAGAEDGSFGWLGGYRPLMDCNGAECLVAWNGPPDPWGCNILCPPPPPSILAARISPSLTLLDKQPLRLNGPKEWVSTLSVSWNELASAWSVAWSLDGRRRVARDGRILDALPEPKSAQSGTLSAIPEGAGWHLAWATTVGGVFHGWSPTGGVRDVERRYIMRSMERESDPHLIGATRPLAFVVRESQLTAGSPAVIGRFLDESTEPVSEAIELTVTRLPSRTVHFSWTTEIDIVSSFVLWGLFDGQWSVIYTLSSDQRVHQRLESGATAYRITANTPAGAFESNVVTMEPTRRRVVGR